MSNIYKVVAKDSKTFNVVFEVDGEDLVLISSLTLDECESLRDQFVDAVSNAYASELEFGDYVCDGCTI